jgi:DNA polymerase III epsilon subunit-like protein
MTKILVFDTETTSLPEKKYNSFDKQKEHERKMLSVSELKKEGNSWSTELEKYPSIIQLAYILYDTDNPSNSKIFNKYIDIPESINISSESQKIHGISKEKIGLMDLFKKASIEDSLNEFMDDFNEAGSGVTPLDIELSRDLSKVSRKCLEMNIKSF